MNPKALYHPLILQHSKQPVRYGKREDAPQTLDAYNPLCGDRFQVYVELADGQVVDLSFYGHGCSVSKASTSVLVDTLRGKTVAEARRLAEQFIAMIEEGAEPAVEAFAPFAAARAFPGRKSCATLPWVAWLKEVE
jgi:nitrogen fixation protein NifU and related proteins